MQASKSSWALTGRILLLVFSRQFHPRYVPALRGHPDRAARIQTPAGEPLHDRLRSFNSPSQKGSPSMVHNEDRSIKCDVGHGRVHGPHLHLKPVGPKFYMLNGPHPQIRNTFVCMLTSETTRKSLASIIEILKLEVAAQVGILLSSDLQVSSLSSILCQCYGAWATVCNMPRVTLPQLPLSGLFAVCKPSGPASMSVLEDIKKLICSSPLFVEAEKLEKGKSAGRRRRTRNVIKIGQGGTLDPLADGVLGTSIRLSS